MRAVIFRWGAPETEAAKRIRFEVFCGEQKVPEELELDDIDAIATHVLLLDDGGKPCGTGRLFPNYDDPMAGRIGRMAVLASARGRGCGSKVLTALIAEGIRRSYERFVLDSQVHAIPFYERHGFQVEGPEHMDAGIPHRMMSLDAADAVYLLPESEGEG